MFDFKLREVALALTLFLSCLYDIIFCVVAVMFYLQLGIFLFSNGKSQYIFVGLAEN
jgi:hypothetical protein